MLLPGWLHWLNVTSVLLGPANAKGHDAALVPSRALADTLDGSATTCHVMLERVVMF